MDESLTAEKIAEYRQVCEAATKGPWTVIGCGGAIVGSGERGMDNGWTGYDVEGPEKAYGRGTFALHDDAAFCVAARTALPACLDEIERLTSERKNIMRYWQAETRQIEANAEALWIFLHPESKAGWEYSSEPVEDAIAEIERLRGEVARLEDAIAATTSQSAQGTRTGAPDAGDE